MGYIPDATLAAMRGAYNLGLFFRLDTTPALHLWWGISDKYATIPNIDVGEERYTGAGILVDLPDAIEVLINGAADRVEWAMNGVAPELTNGLFDTAPSVVGKQAVFAFAPLDDYWQLTADPFVKWVGTGEFWRMDQPVQPDVTKPKTRRLVLSTMTGDSSRALPFFATWTDPIQKLISPTDRFCERVPRYYQGQAIRWPRF